MLTTIKILKEYYVCIIADDDDDRTRATVSNDMDETHLTVTVPKKPSRSSSID
jgi:hypothetical protein